LGLPVGINYGPDANLYVASFNTHKVARYDSISGAYLGDFVTNGSGGLSGPNFMVFRPPVVAAPELAIARASSNAIVTWPEKNVPGVLQQTANLSGTNWIAVTHSISTTAQSNFAEVPLGATNGFVRLQLLE
jgi:hypothetical protein